MKPNRERIGRQSAAALIIVLAFVVLLTGVALAFFSRATSDRQVSYSSASQTSAELLARGGLAVTLGDLKQEISAGSTISTVSGVTIYSSKAPATSTPALVGSSGTGGLENLIKRSANGSAFYPTNANYDTANYPASNRAAAVSTITASQNGRKITPARWNKSFLLQKASLTNDTDATPVTAFANNPPDWINVARDGSNPTAWNTNLITSPANTSSVIGRYSYAIYDEGGLLDMNVAGHPTANTTAQIGRKGSSAFADLTQIPGISNLTTGATGSQTKFLNNIVGWRNYSSAAATGSLGTFSSGTVYTIASGTPFFNYILSNTNGFLLTSNSTLNANQSDRVFASRQQLIALLLRGMASTASDRANLQVALEYFGTFSREYNRPSWKPATTTVINPDLRGIRATTAFNRIDGTPAVQGEPLLKTRFPLSRLSWLTYKGPSRPLVGHDLDPTITIPITSDPIVYQLLGADVSLATIEAGTAANIKTAFGLVWDSRTYVASPRQGQQWVYISPNSATPGGSFDPVTNSAGSTATAIKTLAPDPAHPTWSAVQSEAREPDFLEILKAVILNGSVGLGSNNTANTFVVADPKYYDTTNGKSADYQIMQIEANIMDSWDTDNIPTFMSFGSDPTSVPPNQPYVLAGIENLPYLNKLVYMPSFASGSNDFFDAWLVPSLWNPHQNAPGTGTIRVALNGSGNYWGYGTKKVGNTVTETKAGPISPLPATMDISAAGFAAPAPQTATPTAYTASVTQVTDPSLPYWGFHFPFNSGTTNALLVNKQDADTAYPDFGSVIGASSVELQVYIPGVATPVPYQTWKIAATLHPLICQSAKNNFAASNKLQDPEFVSLDPRAVRFGIWGTDANGQTGAKAKKEYTQGEKDSMDEQNPASRFEQITLYSPQGSSFKVPTLASLYLYAANSQNTNYYTDLDGVQRNADFTSDNGITQGSTILYGTNGANRQRLPSAPFQSVAELGQVFRDQPWKTLNFTIGNSGDVGLLDAFTLQDVPMTAGKTSLNTRQSAVLKAILSQATRSLTGTNAITPTQIDDGAGHGIVPALLALTASNPMISKGELVTRLAAGGDSPIAVLGNKEGRECVIRAFSDACQTRTWNLMIDVIAQSGRYPSAANSLSQFVVEGEKRYWLHVAIDRFTGEVIDQQLEAVYE